MDRLNRYCASSQGDKLRKTTLTALAVLAVGLLACGGAGVQSIEAPATARGSAEGAAYFKAKCKSSETDCHEHAREQCPGGFTVIDKESHAGGLFADALPGPVTWFTITFRCGAPAHESVARARDDALEQFVLPACQQDWVGRCGLLTDKLEKGASLDAPPLAIEAATVEAKKGGLLRHTAAACRETEDALSEKCVASFRRTFVKLLRKRYPMARDERLLSWCDERPEDCDPTTPDKLRLLEQDFLADHDRVVFQAFRQSLAKAEEDSLQDRARAADQRELSSQEDAMRRTRAKLVEDAVNSFRQAQRR